MPLFLKNKIAFIHIPKTGGTSIESVFAEACDPAVFYSTEHIINGHSPQHSTYRELMEWELIPSDFKVISVIRHPYERFVSEYNYRVEHLKNNLSLERFTWMFTKTRAYDSIWDNHHLSCAKFLEGCPPETTHSIEYAELAEGFKRLTGLEMTKHKLKSNNTLKVSDLSVTIKANIQEMWRDDFIMFGYKT